MNDIISALIPLRSEFLPKTRHDIVFFIEFDHPILAEYVGEKLLINKMVTQSSGDSGLFVELVFSVFIMIL